MCISFIIWPILEARIEILTIISLGFWKIYDTTISFWDSFIYFQNWNQENPDLTKKIVNYYQKKC